MKYKSFLLFICLLDSFVLWAKELNYMNQSSESYEIVDSIKNKAVKIIDGLFIDDWTNQECLRAQDLARNGLINEACVLYDDILRQITEIEGQSENYIMALCSKGTDLYLCNSLLEASKIFNEAYLSSISISSENYDTRYCALWGLIITNIEIGEFVKAENAISLAEEFIQNHPLGNSVYNSFNERCFIYSKKARLLYKKGDRVNAEKAINEGLSYYNSHNKSCDIEFKEMLLSELIEEYISDAESLFNKHNYSLGYDYYRKAFNIIKDNPYLGADYLNLIINKQLYDSSIIGIGADTSSVTEFNVFLLGLDSLVFNTAVDLNMLTASYSEWGWQVHQLIGDYTGYIRLKEITVLESIDNNGQYDSITFKKFYAAYTAYKVAIGPSVSSALYSINDYGYPHLSYDDYSTMINGWRNFLLTIVDGFGEEYLDTLYNYSINSEIELGIDRLGVDFREEYSFLEFYLPPLANTYLNEAFLNLLFNKIEAFDLCIKKVFELFNEYGWSETDVEFCNSVCKITDEIEHKGYYDRAVSFITNYYDKVSIIDSTSNIIEKLNTQVGFLACRIGNNKLLEKSVSSAFQLSSLHGEYNKYSNFYNINELINQLILASRYSRSNDKQLSLEFLSIAQQLADDNIKCKDNNGIDKKTKIFLYSEIANTADSVSIAEHAISIINELDTTWNFSNTLNLSCLYANNGEYEKAKILISQILKYVENTEVEPRWKLLLIRVQQDIAIHDGDLNLAHSLLREELSLIEKDFYSLSMMLSDVTRANYWEQNYSSTLEAITSINSKISDNNADIAYDAALFHKGILKRMSKYVRHNVENSNDKALRGLYQNYKKALITNSDSLIEIEADFFHQYSLHPEFFETPSVSNWHDVKLSLKKGEVCIEYTLLLDENEQALVLAAIVLKSNYVAPKIIRLCKQTDLYELLEGNKQANGFSIIYDLSETDGNQLYEYLWKPIESELKGVKTIYYSPYAIMNYISLGSIKKSDNSKCLFEKYNLIRLSSTDEICTKNVSSISSAALFGGLDYYNDQISETGNNVKEKNVTNTDAYSQLRALKEEWAPLNGTQKEIESISTTLSNNNIKVDVFTGSIGSETVFKSLSSKDVSLIHLATHGFYFEEETAQQLNYYNQYNNTKNFESGMRSGLVFSGANKAWKGLRSGTSSDDGILTADEILGMDLSSTDLLVLSACQSALGDSKSDGIYGIQRSFKIAGVNSIIMSLWEVDDAATSLMMQSFYKFYLNGMSKREAFKAAQLEVKSSYEKRAKSQSKSLPKHKRYDSTFYWAAFIMLD